jgi:hypothetical protein
MAGFPLIARFAPDEHETQRGLYIVFSLKGKHKVPPSYSRAGKSGRSLNGTSG